MKKIIMLLLAPLMIMNGFAQTKDWATKPRNPIPFAYTTNHFGYQGNVALVSNGYKVQQFNKDGLLEKEAENGDLTEYVYDANNMPTGLYV